MSKRKGKKKYRGKGKHVRVCRDCGAEQSVYKYQTYKASVVRCSRCGGMTDRKHLVNKSNLPWSVGELPADHPSRQTPKAEPKPEGRQPLPPILKDKTPVEDSRCRIQQVTYIGDDECPFDWGPDVPGSCTVERWGGLTHETWLLDAGYRRNRQRQAAGDFVLHFGKHKGKKLLEVPRGYLYWIKECAKPNWQLKRAKRFVEQYL